MIKLSRIVCARSLSQSKEKETQKLAFNDFAMYFNDLKNIDIWHFILFFLSIFASKEKKKNTNKIHEPQFMSVN